MGLFLDALRRAGNEPGLEEGSPGGCGYGAGMDGAAVKALPHGTSEALPLQAQADPSQADSTLEAAQFARSHHRAAGRSGTPGVSRDPDQGAGATGGATEASPSMQAASQAHQEAGAQHVAAPSGRLRRFIWLPLGALLLAATAYGGLVLGLWDWAYTPGRHKATASPDVGALPARPEPAAVDSTGRASTPIPNDPRAAPAAADEAAPPHSELPIAPRASAKPRVAPPKAIGVGSDRPEFASSSAAMAALESAYASLRADRLEEAQRAYLEVLKEFVEERDALLGLAYIAHRSGRRSLAAAYYRRVLRQEPTEPVARAGLLAVSDELDPRHALQRAADMAELYPESPATQQALAGALLKQGRLADAAQAFASSQALAPGHAAYAYNHAVALDQLHDYARARWAYERAIELSGLPAAGGGAAFPLAAAQQRLEQLRAAATAGREARP